MILLPKRYRWDESQETLVEIPREEPSASEILEAERDEWHREEDRLLRDQYPGQRL